MRIAVTGGNGRVGSAVTAQALSEGHSVVSIDLARQKTSNNTGQICSKVADCTDFEGLHDAMKGCDALVHLAAIPSPGRHPDHLVQSNNVVGSYNAIGAAIENGISRICQASSVNAIGLAYSRRARFDYFPIDEKHPNYGEDPYSLSKWICEQQADCFARRHADISISSLRFHYVSPDRAAAEKVFNSSDKETDKHLWGYTLASSAAQACILSLGAAFIGHEVYYITEPDTTHERPSADLAREFFPEVEITGDLSGHKSFFSSEKARRLLAW